MCKFILRRDIPWNISSSFWICSSAGKGSDAFGVDHAFETARAQPKRDVWGTKRGQQCSKRHWLKSGQRCEVGNGLSGVQKWKMSHAWALKAMQRMRKQQPPNIREKFLLPHPWTLHTYSVSSFSENQPPLFSCVASLLASGSWREVSLNDQKLKRRAIKWPKAQIFQNS